ncbi:hypothetical protein MLD38_040023 [Melastoma candidum]|uniref:Uncharacterized protein n=1 Tax=Melastoma candidum TaxID=119954 RepID=A0ACB9L4D9_9MYRT|nr:hypothetical protein MLD38_040023 [Melastoma candidum]
MDSNDPGAAAEILKLAFGESSDEEDSQFLLPPPVPPSAAWDPIVKINGLWLCRHFLSPSQQLDLLSAIDAEGWFSTASHNQAMRFGNLPDWAVQLSDSIKEAVVLGNRIYGSEHCAENILSASTSPSISPIFPRELLNRELLFDQLIVNSYQPGEGICAHVDLLRFEDGIAIVSLESPCVMHFSRAAQKHEGLDMPTKEEDEAAVGVLLTPGSLVVMSGEARYLWKHEINRKPGFQVWLGEELVQSRRISITLRKLCSAV